MIWKSIFPCATFLACSLASLFVFANPNLSELNSVNSMFENNNTNPKSAPDANASWKSCLLPDSDFPWHSARPDPSGLILAPACQPEVLYTWLTQDRFENTIQTFGDGPWNPRISAMYASKGPLASFGYGSVSIRFKIRPGTKFKIVQGSIDILCRGIPDREKDNTVYVRIDQMDVLADYTFCSSNVIHSWSFGTKGHSDEMIRDLRLLIRLMNEGKDLRGKMELYSSKQGSDFFRNFNLDPGFDGTIEKLKSNLIHTQQLSQRGGRVFVNPALGISNEQAAREHFQSLNPMYFMRTP